MQYHRKIVRLWEKYDCFTNSAKQKQMQSSHHGCPKSQSFYTPPANAMSNLVQVTHNPDTNLTTTNVASPQTPKTHTLSTEASRVRKFKFVCTSLVMGFLTMVYKTQTFLNMNPIMPRGVVMSLMLTQQIWCSLKHPKYTLYQPRLSKVRQLCSKNMYFLKP